MRIGLVQMNTQKDKAENLAEAERLIDVQAREGARLIMLPEYFNFLGPEKHWRKNSEELHNSMSLGRVQEKAIEHKVFIHCGSFLEKSGSDIHNTAVVFDPLGDIVAKYRKIHLFDVEVPGGRKYFESETITAGNEVVTFTVDGIIFGMATCYDLRFPELFRVLSARGVQVILVPAAFTMMTGKDHWELLLRARAVENLCYVAAAGQYGSCPPSYVSFGRSMVVDPWGVVISQARDSVTTISAEVDMKHLAEVRKTFPALDHVRSEMFG
ncbi:carbon-nitrogen hydrolase family protein [Desulfopila inferna]|uniref:carbon-nitrogen hydrolase family protein n=1 Tax=Desulfopila inferna TaxID=468528 RepID=UPI001963D870|nr:carbon-nitrogen hydrolase family protein [Desulfopila inferna]MBM9605335.1 carbon-nitrogen hydrolase family protein [Desulfopila inferna]